MQTISVTQDRIRIAQFLNGRFRVAFLFEDGNIAILEIAIGRTKLDDPLITNVGRVPMRCGGFIEVGAGCGILVMRKVNSSGKIVASARIEGSELVALAFAVTTFKQSLAAHAAESR